MVLDYISKFKSTNVPNSITENTNDELGIISNWQAVNKLSVNANKSNYMVFHPNKMQSSIDAHSWN